MSALPDMLQGCGAIIRNSHFVYTSGRHGPVYVNKDALYPHTEMTSAVGAMFAEKYANAGVEVVVSPALGGIALSQWTAHHLSRLAGQEVPGVYTEKDEHGNQIFRRGYDAFVNGKRVLIVEDVTNTGASAKKVVEAVRNAGGTIVAVCVMINRNPREVNSETMDAPFSALEVFPTETYDEKECPLCRDGIPVNTSVGHGREFLQRGGLSPEGLSPSQGESPS